MDKIDAFYELEKRYDNLQLNYDFSIKINGHFKINIDFYNEPNNKMSFEMALSKDDSLELIHVMAVPENKMNAIIEGLKRLVNCIESKLTTVIDEELIKYGFYLEYGCDEFLDDLQILSRLSRVTQE